MPPLQGPNAAQPNPACFATPSPPSSSPPVSAVLLPPRTGSCNSINSQQDPFLALTRTSEPLECGCGRPRPLANRTELHPIASPFSPASYTSPATKDVFFPTETRRDDLVSFLSSAQSLPTPRWTRLSSDPIPATRFFDRASPHESFPFFFSRPITIYIESGNSVLELSCTSYLVRWLMRWDWEKRDRCVRASSTEKRNTAGQCSGRRGRSCTSYFVRAQLHLIFCCSPKQTELAVHSLQATAGQCSAG